MRSRFFFCALLAILAIGASLNSGQARQPVRQQLLSQQEAADPAAAKVLSARLQKAMGRVGYPTVTTDDVPLVRSFYRTAFSKQHCQAKWVMWALTPSMLSVNGKRSPFTTDHDLEQPEWRVEKWDYEKSGFSRGHMMPAADCRFAEKASLECALMSNICPQTAKLNNGAWNALEIRCREWCRIEDTLFIVCGPIYNSDTPQKIGISHLLDVPDSFFKIVLSTRKGHEKMLGFVMANNEYPAKMREAVCSVASIEQETGIVFFPNLPKEVKERLDQTADYWEWKTPKQLERNYSSNYYGGENRYQQKTAAGKQTAPKSSKGRKRNYYYKKPSDL